MGTTNFTVDPLGKVWPCHIMCNNSEPLGILGEEWGVMRNRYEKGFGAKIKKSLFSECKTCFLKEYCSMCPIAWKQRGGEANPIKSQCELDRKAYLTALKLSLINQREKNA